MASIELAVRFHVSLQCVSCDLKFFTGSFIALTKPRRPSIAWKNCISATLPLCSLFSESVFKIYKKWQLNALSACSTLFIHFFSSIKEKRPNTNVTESAKKV